MAKATTSAEPRQASWGVTDALAVAVGFGLLAGLVEIVAAVLRQHWLHRTLYLGPDLVWQLPLTDALSFLVVALLLVGFSAVWPRLRTPRVILALCSALALYSAFLLTERIHAAAEAVLAAGLGIALSRGLVRHSDRLRKSFRIAAPVAVVLLFTLAAVMRLAASARERARLAALPAAATGRPNILILLLDTVRAWDMGMYGYGRNTTPNLNQWAAQGAVFERALAPAPWTTLSHAVMWTGRYPTELSVGWRTPLDRTYPTFAEALLDAGYATAGFAGNYLNVGRGTGLARGFLHYEDYPLRLIPLLRQTTLLGRLLAVDRIAALVGRRRMVQSVVGEQVNQHFLRWLDGHGKQPWFAFLNYFDAHGPYLPPAPYDTLYFGKPDPPVDRYWNNLQRAYGPPPLPVQFLAVSLDAYDGGISYLDLQVDALLRGLAERRQLTNTIVVVTSDHGELFGEHTLVAHGNNLYLPVLHVPLILIAPGRVPAGARPPSLASLRDLPATLFELAGVRNPGFPGHSLTALWTPSAGLVSDTLFAALDYHRLMPKWPPAPVLRGDMRTVVLDSLQYIRNGDGAEELYHLGRDPWEVRNLVTVPAYQAALTRYRAALSALPERSRAPVSK
jgi:arylsulfatase A-like enzyme